MIDDGRKVNTIGYVKRTRWRGALNGIYPCRVSSDEGGTRPVSRTHGIPSFRYLVVQGLSIAVSVGGGLELLMTIGRKPWKHM